MGYVDGLFYYVQVQTSTGQADGEAPAWAPLRDSYMLTNSKLKDWDKMPVRNLLVNLVYLSDCSILRIMLLINNILLETFVQDNPVTDEIGRMSEDSSSDGDD